MKKAILWTMILSYAVLFISLGVMGLKIFDHEYEFLTEAHVALVCLFVILVCDICRLFTNRCPHCGKLRLSGGKYCSHCGKEIDFK